MWWNDFVVSSHYDRTVNDDKDGDLSWWNDFVVSSHYDRTSRTTRCGTSPWWMGLVLSAHYGESCACYTLYDLPEGWGLLAAPLPDRDHRVIKGSYQHRI